MSEYKLEVNGNIQLGDYCSIHDYMGLVGIEDKLIVKIDGADAENYKIICNILQSDNFMVCAEEVEKNGKYYITAYKKK